MNMQHVNFVLEETDKISQQHAILLEQMEAAPLMCFAMNVTNIISDTLNESNHDFISNQ